MKKANLIRFIHIKKNGGTSVYKFLRKNGIDFRCGDSQDVFRLYNQHGTALKYSSEPSWKFCVIRNPYSRVVSFYTWCKRIKKFDYITFEDFVKKPFNRGRARGVWNLQKDYMVDLEGHILIDKVFRFESLSTDIPEHFNIQKKFPHLNKSTEIDFREFYNKELQEIVYHRLIKDFRYLNYNFELE